MNRMEAAFFRLKKIRQLWPNKTRMLITGAKGFAKQLLDVVFQLELQDGLVFYDDFDSEITQLLSFPVLKSLEEASRYFSEHGPEFALGTGNPTLRHQMKIRLEAAGGQCISLISPLARVARYAKIGKGTCILTGAVVENDAQIGEGALINLNAMICHDSRIGNFVEVSPAAVVTGGCTIGDFSFIGSAAVLKPGIHVGKKTTVAAGAVVIKDLPDACMAAGVPATVKRL